MKLSTFVLASLASCVAPLAAAAQTTTTSTDTTTAPPALSAGTEVSTSADASASAAGAGPATTTSTAATTPSTPPPPSSYVHSYIDGSVVLWGAGGYGINAIPGLPTGDANFSGLGTFAARLMLRALPGLALEARASLGFANTSDRPGVTSLTASISPAVAAGWAFGLTDAIALTPMLVYQLNILAGNGRGAGWHDLHVEVPAAFFLNRNAFIEPYVSGGILFGDVPDVRPVVGAGFRIGVVL